MDYKHVLSIIDNESEKFDSVITKTEKAMLSAAVNAIKKLDVDASGNIRTTTANIKLLATIRTKLATVASNKEFMSGVKSVANAMDQLYKAQVDFYSKAFPQKTLGENAKKKHQALQQIAISNVASGLSQSALTASVVEPLNKMLLRAVTSGAKYADLIDEFHKQLESSDDSTSALAKYAKTYATTAMTQLAGENNRLFTDDLGAEWFQYVGSVIETSRQFCELLTEKEYIHKSEIKGILNGRIEIDGTVHECEMNAKTGLPKGLIEGTTEQNFQVNVGGWNCRHQLIPISELMVPEHIRAKFDKGLQEKLIKQREDEEKKKKIDELQKQLEQFEDWKDIDSEGIHTAITNGDILLLEKYLNDIREIENELTKLDLLANPKDSIKEFKLSDLKTVNAAVEKTLSRWRWDEDIDSLNFLKAKLEREISFVESNKKYKTWELARDAYKKRLEIVNYKIEKANLSNSIADAIYFAKKLTDNNAKNLLNEWEQLNNTNASIQELKDIAQKIEDLYRANNTTSIVDDVDNFINSPIGVKYKLQKSDLKITSKNVAKLSNQGYLALSESNKTTPDEYSYSRRYVQTSNSFSLNGKLDDVGGDGLNMSTKNYINPNGRDMYGVKMTTKDILDIQRFDNVIASRKLPFDIDIVRVLDDSGLASQFGVKNLYGKDLESALNNLIGKPVIANRYLSFSTNINKNVFANRPDRNVIWHSIGKKGTHCYVAENPRESEVVFGRGMNLTLKKVKYDENADRFEIWADVEE